MSSASGWPTVVASPISSESKPAGASGKPLTTPETSWCTATAHNVAFSDGFHPTPYGHRLLAASISRALARAGWL